MTTVLTFDVVAFAANVKKDAMSVARKGATQRIKHAKKRIPLAAAFHELGLIEDYRVEGVIKYGTTISIKVEQLPLVKRAVMSCGYTVKESVLTDTNEYILKSAVDRTVKVYLTCKVLDDVGIRVAYEKILPADAKCRIVKQEYDTLVCE